jgi:TolB-like protein
MGLWINMKNCKLTTTFIYLLLLCAVGTHAQTVTLDNAINGAVDTLSPGLNRSSMIAVLSMRTDSSRMASYLIEEITSAIVNQRLFTVVDRSQLDLIRQEEQFQLSGEVSDESAQAIGKKLGAQVIITGSFETLGDYHRFRMRVIEVQTAAILETYSANVRNDSLVISLLGNGEPEVPVYADFATGQRWGTGALNMFIPGLGSYVIMRDGVGGTIHLGLMAIGGVFTYLGVIDSHYTINRQRYSLRIPGFIAGSLFLLGGTVFNVTRSAFYQKPHSKTASLIDPQSWNIAIRPGENGIEQIHLSYTIRF